MTAGHWGLAQIHAILTRTTYIGEHRFNTRSHKDRERRSEGEIAIMACPPLIDRETFDAVQVRLKSRDPRMTPARVTSGPTLLTGICFCAKCGGAMTLRTGKGIAGGTYRSYNTCSTKARQGRTGCEGRSIPMDRLDQLVTKHLEDRLLQPERLETILASVLDRRQERAERRHEHLAELHKRITETDQRLNRLFDAIESGVADLDAPGLKERIAGLKAIREQASAPRPPSTTPATRLSAPIWSRPSPVRPASVCGSKTATTAANTCARWPSASRSRTRKSAPWGTKSELLRTFVAVSGGKSIAFGVQSSVLKWRARRDPNS